jgi:hypothetical protein
MGSVAEGLEPRDGCGSPKVEGSKKYTMSNGKVNLMSMVNGPGLVVNG